MPEVVPPAGDLDVIIVGAGLAGLYLLHKVRSIGFSARVYDSASDVGGTWFWNRYPGARCDVESVDYSYSFSTELQETWEWTERYAGQGEILAYINHVADRFGLRDHVELGVRVDGAIFDEHLLRWTVRMQDGRVATARYLVTAVGCLSAPRVPEFADGPPFAGRLLFTNRWPAAHVDFAGRRVAIVGTGSSGVQAAPVIARSARQVIIFQRTPAYSVPARNQHLSADFLQRVKDTYAERRHSARWSNAGVYRQPPALSALEVSPAQREQIYEQKWDAGGPGFMSAFNDLMVNLEANRTAAAFWAAQIRKVVRDPERAEMLIPRSHPIGAKRLCVDTGYFEMFNFPHVSLVDVAASPITEITVTGIRAGGKSYPVDDIVMATGFDAMTGAILSMDIRGRGNVPLRHAWRHGPQTYLGVAVSGFPNFFMITGPGSPAVLTNMVMAIEQHVDWIADCLAFARRGNVRAIEATPRAQDGWMQTVRLAADRTLFVQADSWYLGANVPGKPRVFMPYAGGLGRYRAICDHVTASGYQAFTCLR